MAECLLSDRIENALRRKEIGTLRRDYLKFLETNPFPSISGKHYPTVLAAFKREKRDIGPYTAITPFEAANRIASDLTLMEGVLQLFRKNLIPEDARVQLRLGTMQQKDKGDFSVKVGNKEYQGEAFDVNPSFFRSKLGKTISSWKGKKVPLKYVIFNSDCLKDAACNTFFLGVQDRNRRISFLGVRSWHI